MRKRGLFLVSFLVLSFFASNVFALSVTRFVLVNANTDTDIGVMANDYVINFANLPTRNLNIRAEVDSSAGSVRFALDSNSNYRTENSAPYALAGDNSGNYNSWTPSLGKHTLKATPYSGSSAGGTVGSSLTINFSVIDQAIVCSDSDGGKNYNVRGSITVEVSGSVKTDFCIDSNFLSEYYCNNGVASVEKYSCYNLSPYGCGDGACKIPPASLYNVSISVATLKDSYKVNEQINLTDPPDGEIFNTNLVTGNIVKGSNLDIKEGIYRNIEGNFLVNKNVGERDETRGYIVKLREVPLAVVDKKLKDNKKDTKEIKNKLKTHKVKIDNEHKIAKNKIRESIGKTKQKSITGKAIEENKEFNFLIEWIKRIFSGREISGYAISESELEGKILAEYDIVFNGIALDITDEEAKEIEKLDEVEAVYPNMKVETMLMDSVPLIGADQVWQKDASGNLCNGGESCLTGKGIKIAVIDTGVDYTHPDLGGCLGTNCKVIGGYDFVNNDNDPMDDNGHGTHVAATAAGKGVLNGVALDAQIYAYKVLSSSGSGSFANVMNAIERATDPNKDGYTSDHVDVISMSLGGLGNPDDAPSQAVDNAVDAGIVVVVAAGNCGPGGSSTQCIKLGNETISSPGTARKAITVGATYKKDYTGTYWRDSNPRADQIASFSSLGPVIGKSFGLVKPDIVAPGAIICAAEYESYASNSKCLDDKHIEISGTSMATPHVAGAVALIKQAHPDWSSEEIKNRLKETAKGLGYDENVQGAGRIDILKSVQANSYPPVAQLITGGKEIRKIDVIGTAKGRDFANYSLFYKTDYNDQWNLLKTGYTPVENGIIYAAFDLLSLASGKTVLRLVVYNKDNSRSEDIAYFQNSLFEIYNPLSNDIIRAGDKVEINGSISLNNFRYYIEYAKADSPSQWYSNNITINYDGSSSVSNKTLGVWDTSSIKTAGLYHIRISVEYNGKNSYLTIKNIYLDPSLRKGWPQKLYSESGTELAIRNEINPVYESMSYISDSQSEELVSYRPSDAGIDSLSMEARYSYWVGHLIPVVSDIDKDGRKEVIVYKGGNPPKLIVYREDGSVYWERGVGSGPVGGGNLNVPAVADLDGDGKDEIVLSLYVDNDIKNSYLYRFDYSGNIKWISNFTKAYNTFTLISDLDKDGEKEIVTKRDSSNRGITIFNKEGKIIYDWNIPPISHGGEIESQIAVGNFDDDNDLEIVVAEPSENEGPIWENGQLVGWVNEGIIHVYNKEGTYVSGWPRYVPGYILSSPVVGDINKDGRHDIVVGLMYDNEFSGFPNESYGGLYAFDRNGNILSGWPLLKGLEFWSTPSLLDFNSDGYLEIAASTLGGPSSYTGTYLIMHNGIIYNGWPKKTPWANYYGTIAGNTNNDGIVDILASNGGIFSCPSNCGGVSAWDAKGSNLIEFPKVTEVDAKAPAAIYDLDNDGKPEVIASSDSDYDTVNQKGKSRGSIYIWNLGSISSSPSPWPTYMHDAQHTGCYDCVKPSPQSKIVNNGDTSLFGTITLRIDNYAGSNTWITQRAVVWKGYNLQPKEVVKLDKLWNPNNVTLAADGKYRVYAEFKHYQGKVKVNATWEFDVI